MKRRKKILYIQHAGGLSGSCMSLLYTLQGLDQERFEPVVALIRPHQDILDFYQRAGITTLPAPGIQTFEHTTASWAHLRSPLGMYAMSKSLVGWKRSQQRTREVVRAIAPDLVHLNSVVLVPSALALHKARIPFVWHVREAPVHGYWGLRKRFMERLLETVGNEILFLSHWDRDAWIHGRRGEVLYNFVDLKHFHPEMSPQTIQKDLNIQPQDRVILFMGGINEIKGILVLLEALALVRIRIPQIVCVVLFAQVASSGRLISRIARSILPFFGSGVFTQRVEQTIQRLHLESYLRLLPFQPDVAPFIAASDVIVFPSLRPHFARPVIEAAAMGKSVIGSNLGGVNELIEHDRTGLLVEPNSPVALARAVEQLLMNPEKMATFGENALLKAQAEFNADRQVARLMEIYETILR